MRAIDKYKTENVSVDFSDPQVRKNMDIFDEVYKVLDEQRSFEEKWPIESAIVKVGKVYYEYTKYKQAKPTGNMTTTPFP